MGPVTLSASLWRILCDEADQNVAVLQHEVSVLQFDPDHMPVAAMVRASHTLCGIHRTGGIALIATTARALEQALLALEERGAPFPSTAQPVLARATAGLAHFVSRVKQPRRLHAERRARGRGHRRRARGDAQGSARRRAGRRAADSRRSPKRTSPLPGGPAEAFAQVEESGDGPDGARAAPAIDAAREPARDEVGSPFQRMQLLDANETAAALDR